MPNYKDTLQIQPDDPRLKSDFITYNSPKGGGEIKGLLSQPADSEGKLLGIIVVHENQGLNPYIEDVGRRTALKKNNKEYTAYVYPDVNHGFHNDSTPRYDKEAAELAWKRTIEFFKEKLV